MPLANLREADELSMNLRFGWSFSFTEFQDDAGVDPVDLTGQSSVFAIRAGGIDLWTKAGVIATPANGTHAFSADSDELPEIQAGLWDYEVRATATGVEPRKALHGKIEVVA